MKNLKLLHLLAIVVLFNISSSVLTKTISNKKKINYIYAPWRESYTNKPHSKEQKKECPFCSQLQENKDDKNYIIKRFKHCAVMLNLYPYTAGHLLIIPYSHSNSLNKLSKEEYSEITDIIRVSENIIKELINPDGLNIGLNLGKKETGTSIPDHLHVHIVPRYLGDASFLTTVSNTHIITKDLNKLYTKYKDIFDKLEF